MLSPGIYERDAESGMTRRAGRGDAERGLGGEYLSEDDPEKDGESHRRERPVSVRATILVLLRSQRLCADRLGSLQTQRSLSQYSVGPEYDDRLGTRSTPTVSYQMDKLRIHPPPVSLRCRLFLSSAQSSGYRSIPPPPVQNVYQPLDDATLRANAPGLDRKPTFYQEVKAIKLHHQMKRELERRQSWD